MMKYRETKQPQIPVNHCAWCGSYDLEIGWQQREAVTALLAANGWTDIVCRKDFGGNDRCVMARKQ